MRVLRALELVGERWALLVLRDLLFGPKRFSDLQRGLPGIPSNILTARLKELEESGVIQRRALPRPPGGVAYESTEDGRRLERAVIKLGRKNGTVDVDEGPVEHPDLVIEAGPGIRAVMAQEISPDQALKAKIVHVRGDRKLFTTFARMFRI